MHSQTPLQIHRQNLKPGLYIVATPIGNLADITLRALQTLTSVAVIACEDTRMTLRLLRHYGIETRTDSYHDHNAAQKRPVLIERALKEPVALVSDAGTPLISDPGYKLVREAVEAGVHVEAIPGASAVLTALCIGGLPTDRFLFAGFLPTRETAMRKTLQELAPIRSTLVFYESAKRLAETLAIMRDELGEREAAVVRELTKLYEEARRGTLAELAAAYAKEPEPRGEIVLLIGPPAEEEASAEDMDTLLRRAMQTQSLKESVQQVSAVLNLPKGAVYARALELKEGK